MRTDAIMVEVEPDELRETEPGVVDVFDALGRQFFLADVVMVAARDSHAEPFEAESHDDAPHDRHDDHSHDKDDDRAR